MRDSPSILFIYFLQYRQRDVNYPSGWCEKQLHQLQFIDQDGSTEPFEFLDTDNIIRGVQLLPAFASGLTDKLLGPSKARRKLDDAPDGEDWNYYYVNM